MNNGFASLAFAVLVGGCVGSNAVTPPVRVQQQAGTVPPLAVKAAEAGYCERVRDGNKIARIQMEVERLLERLRSDPTFAWAKYEHAPCYRVVLAFTDGTPPPWLLEEASAELRPLFRFDRARLPLSHIQFEQARQEVFAALKPTGVKALIAVRPDAQRIEIGVRTEAEAQLVRSVIPVRHRAITKVFPGGYAEPIQRTRQRTLKIIRPAGRHSPLRLAD